MIVVRDVFRAKYGSGGDLENVFKEMLPSLERAITEVGGGDGRMMEDLSGAFFTIVVEYTLPSLSAWEGAGVLERRRGLTNRHPSRHRHPSPWRSLRASR